MDATLVSGTLTVNGTTGNDTIGIAIKGTQVRAAINGVVTKFTAAAVARIEVYALAGADSVDVSGAGIPTYVLGGDGNDVIRGGSANDTLTGAAGKDTILGNGGDDRIDGGKHPDIINGGDGEDRIYGGEGSDLIYGGNDKDRIWPEAGQDTVYGEAGNDVINTVDGEPDVVNGGPGYNYATTDTTGDTVALIRNLTKETFDPTGGDGTGNNGGAPSPIDTSSKPLAISLNDESLWDNNFDTAVAQMKTLGVKAVRIFVSINSFDDRPSATDMIDYAEIVNSWKGTERPLIAGLAMKRAFALKRAGFTVLATINNVSGQPPASAAQVTNFYTYMMNSVEGNGSSTKLKSAIDYWEVGNEIDLSTYWAPSGQNKPAGLKQYVDEVLIPAAAALHSGAQSTWESVVSPSVSYSPGDMNTILGELKTKNSKNAIDAIGFHPYGRYLPDQNIDEIGDRSGQAVGYAAAFGKPLIATEWNVRGFANNGSQDSTWASAITSVYNSTIKPDYLMGFYFALTNNFAGRGGSSNITARPAGLLQHDFDGTVTSSSSTEDLLDYYESPLIPSDPFYSAYNGLS